MYIFIDESGDLGLDFYRKNPSRFFIITALVCTDRNSLYAVRKAAEKTLKRKLNHSKKRYKSEIKGSGSVLSVKKYFYAQLSEMQNIKIHSAILDKKSFSADRAHNICVGKHDIYTRLTCLTLDSVFPEGSEVPFVHIIADRCKRGREEKEFSLALRLHLENRLSMTSKITIEQIRSTSDYGLQAVDLFSYGIFQKYDTNCVEWYKYFQKDVCGEIVVKK